MYDCPVTTLPQRHNTIVTLFDLLRAFLSDQIFFFFSACPETAVHLFWHCFIMRIFWRNPCDFITEHIDESFVLLWKNVLFGQISYQ